MSTYQKDWRELRMASFDVETTGKEPNSKVLEIGIIIFEASKPVERYCKLINPGKTKINATASKVHGITKEMVENKKPLSERIKRIDELLKSVDIWCAFNDDFDRGVLKEEYKREGLKWANKPTIDPLIWARYLWQGMPNKLVDVVQKLRISPNRKALKQLNIKKKHHRADYDSYITALCLFDMSKFIPKTLIQTLYVQDFLYRMWVLNMGDKKFARNIDPTLPEI